MKRYIYILVSTFVVFLVTLAATNIYMSREAVREADELNDDAVQEIRRRLDINLMMREKAVVSFLAGLFDCQQQMNDSGTVVATRVTIRKKDEASFPAEVYTSLENFKRMNQHILNAMFIVDRGVYPQYPDGFAPLVSQNSSEHLDIASTFDYAQSDNYRQAQHSPLGFWTLPSQGSVIYGEAITYYMPIFREDGRFFGTFTINVDNDILRDGLVESLPYDMENSAVVVTDSMENIILSTYKPYEDYRTLANFRKDISRNAEFHIDGNSTRLQHDRITWEGHRYFLYHRLLTKAPWYTITICCEDAIYASVKHTRNIIYVVSFTGMLLLLLCCMIIFRQARRQLTQQAAMESELKLSARVQSQMLKAPVVTVPEVGIQAVLQPAREAGGDLYDYVINEGHLLFCIGDVSGKGMPAALFMTQVCSLFRNAIRTLSEPRDIVAEINSVLSDNNPTMTFCTLFVGNLDLASGLLTFCNAGHEKPLLIAPSAPTLSAELRAIHPNIAVGIAEGYPYKAETIQLHPGMRLVLYTDGVTEAKNIRHAFFGEERIIEAFAHADDTTLSDCTAVLLSAVKAFTQDAEQSDDITIMTITYTDTKSE